MAGKCGPFAGLFEFLVQLTASWFFTWFIDSFVFAHREIVREQFPFQSPLILVLLQIVTKDQTFQGVTERLLVPAGVLLLNQGLGLQDPAT